MNIELIRGESKKQRQGDIRVTKRIKSNTRTDSIRHFGPNIKNRLRGF